MSASALPYDPHSQVPKAMDRADMDDVKAAYVAAARRANRADFDMLELHMAHGYLLSCFLSPLTNVRTDEYGGSLENRARFPLEVLDAVREVPGQAALGAHLGGRLVRTAETTEEDSVAFARMLKAHGCDIVDVSSGGNSPDSKPVFGRMYQVPFAERIRHEAGVPVMAVGDIPGADHANTVLARRARRSLRARPAAPGRSVPHAARGDASTGMPISPGRISTSR